VATSEKRKAAPADIAPQPPPLDAVEKKWALVERRGVYTL
jgi:hypothetical protein